MAKDSPALPKPRLCHLRKWPDFSGYGFNLHAEKGKAGHFIGKVDDVSPALAGGLRQGDRIVEVNGTNIGNENHQQVVARIQSVPHETRILVLDRDADEFYCKNRVVVRGDMREVEIVETPLVNPFTKRPDVQYRGKECDLKVWPNFIGYGFNLHAEKGNPSHIIGKVDPRSPAEATGMTEGDRIVEVNGVNVLDEPHLDVVRRIKSDPRKVSLLLVSEDCETFLRENGASQLDTVVDVSHIVCPDVNPFISAATTTVDSPRAGTESQVTANPQNVKEVSLHPNLPESSVSSRTSLPFVTEAQKPPEAQKPLLRLCLMKRPEKDPKSYGFSMHATKGLPGHYITEVDPDSVAKHAGLRKGDRIIEVNGANVEKVTHKRVVEMIKEVPNETCLLVVNDPQDHNCSTTSSKAESSTLEANRSHNLQSTYIQNQNAEEDSEDNMSADYRVITDEMIAVAEREAKTDQISASDEVPNRKGTVSQASAGITPETNDERKNDGSAANNGERSTGTKKSPVVISGIEFAPSAEEARRRMAKKSRVKEENLSIRDKFRLFERL